ncbi:hypothetical protein ACFL6I_27195 [candidate division KSB1 bacterium]
MDDDTTGQKAIDELNQSEFDGKVINVNVAKPRVERSQGNTYSSQRNNDYNSKRRGYNS